MFFRSFVIAILCISSNQAYGEVLIDDFTSGSTTLSGSSASQTETSLPGVLGGGRFIGWNGVGSRGGTPPPGSTMTMSVDTSEGGSFNYQGAPYLTATNFQLRYDGGSSNPPGMNVNLFGTDMLAIDFASADFSGGYGMFDIRISSYNAGVHGSRYMFTRVDNAATPFTLLLPLTGPNPPYGNTLDIHHVSEINIGSGNGGLPGFFEISAIRAVPEPSMVVMSCTIVGLLPFLSWRRRVSLRRQKGVSRLRR